MWYYVRYERHGCLLKTFMSHARAVSLTHTTLVKLVTKKRCELELIAFSKRVYLEFFGSTTNVHTHPWRRGQKDQCLSQARC
jgi:hypothetical protein